MVEDVILHHKLIEAEEGVVWLGNRGNLGIHVSARAHSAVENEGVEFKRHNNVGGWISGWIRGWKRWGSRARQMLARSGLVRSSDRATGDHGVGHGGSRGLMAIEIES